MNKNKRICLTTGDYNGIGPEIIIKALNSLKITPESVVLIGNKKVFNKYSSLHNKYFELNYKIVDVPFDDNDYTPGKETEAAGEFSYRCLERASELVKSGECKAIVTAPVSKNALCLAGHNFSGQTEVLEKFLAHDNQKAEMLFTADNFRVLLLTRHVQLAKIKITKDLIIEKISRLNNALKEKFKIESPSLALCALNPHAGENGILGDEEIKEFMPAVVKLQEQGVKITRPLPADTLFVQAASDYRTGFQTYDCYIACYHDQGLIPIKMLAMDNCVNTTIGLDVIRTSPAHGTAYDIAPYCCARSESMQAAIISAFNINM